MARKGISIPMAVIVVFARSVQTFHLGRPRYCKSDAEWTSTYERRLRMTDEDNS